MPTGPSNPFQSAFAVTPSSTTVFPGIKTAIGSAQVTRALYFGSAGSATVTMVDGGTASYLFPAGTTLFLQVTQVQTASGGSIVGLF
jgi:hypothetical protein